MLLLRAVLTLTMPMVAGQAMVAITGRETMVVVAMVETVDLTDVMEEDTMEDMAEEAVDQVEAEDVAVGDLRGVLLILTTQHVTVNPMSFLLSVTETWTLCVQLGKLPGMLFTKTLQLHLLHVR